MESGKSGRGHGWAASQWAGYIRRLERDGWMYQLVVTVHLLNASDVLLLQVQVGQVNICSSVYETYNDKKTSL